MPELQNSQESDPSRPRTVWPSKLKNRSGVAEELAKKMSNNVAESKPSVASRGTCICSPTNHAGSFRCHLHRFSAGQLSPWRSEDGSGRDNSNSIKLDPMNVTMYPHFSKGAPQLSRFGRAAFAGSNEAASCN